MSYQVIRGDCLEYLNKMKDKEFNAVITDPNYGIGESAYRVASRENLAKATDYGDFDWDNEPADQRAIDHILRVSEKQVIFGGNYFVLPPTSCWIIWDKVNGSNDFADCEMAWTNLKSATRLFRHQWNGFLRETERKKRVHPSQKPVALMRFCISKLNLAPGSTILDPYAGSGSVGIAAILAGHNYIAIEKDERYCKIMKERLDDAVLMVGREFKKKEKKELVLDDLPLFA